MNTYTGEVKLLAELTADEKQNGQWKEIVGPDLGDAERVQLELTGRTQVSRNSPCPCGSRKRFKRCCMTGPTK
jgi:uncharacterized protein YecA (UPF0149 family)